MRSRLAPNLFAILAAAAMAVVTACDRAPHAPPASEPPPEGSGSAPSVAPATPSADAGSIEVAISATPPTSATRLGAPVALPSGASGYVALPSGAGKHGAVIVLQEFWGLDDWIREDTDRFAKLGYVALAVDLYRGRSTTSADEAHELMRGLPEDRAMADMQTGFAWLAARPDVDAKRIGVVGWCMGGGYALALATDQPRLRAVAMNYGRLVTAPDKIAKVHAALLGNFAGQDRGIAPDDVHAFERQLKVTNRDVDIKVYEPDGHAFMNPNNKKGYDEAGANDAWTRIEGFFGRTLASPQAAVPPR